jgi:hypothetical protein
MGNESPHHNAFKKIGIDLLKEEYGFRPEQIFEDYNVEVKENGTIKYKIDLVGISETYKIAVECGDTQLSKLSRLRKIFNEVMVINVTKVVELYEVYRRKYLILKEESSREIERLKAHAEWVCQDANSKIDPLKNTIEELKRENANTKAALKKLQGVLAQAWKASQEEQS